MTLKNFLIVVKDIEVSKAFYRDLFGLQIVTDFGGNVIMSGGLVLQEKTAWEKLIEKESVMGDCCAELYFEENNLEMFIEKLEQSTYDVKMIQPLTKHTWGQKVVRMYDPDGHMIEVGTPSWLWEP